MNQTPQVDPEREASFKRTLLICAVILACIMFILPRYYAPKDIDIRGANFSHQTWSMTYRETTCWHWENQMNDAQQLIAAGDFWRHFKNQRGDMTSVEWNDAERFRDDIDAHCVGSQRKITTAASAAYVEGYW